MLRLLLCLAITGTLLSACVPKNQYDALVTERNYYRNQIAEADSLAELRGLSTYDNNASDQISSDLAQRIRQIEALTATNVSLNEAYLSLQDRYEQLLTQNQDMLSANTNQVTDLQRDLATRTAELSRRENELRQRELDLRSREQSMAATGVSPAGDSRYAQAGAPAAAPTPGAPTSYGTAITPGQSYGQPQGTTPLNALQNSALTLNNIQSELSQVLAYLPNDTYVLAGAGPNRLQLTVTDPTLFSDGFTVSRRGQDLVRRIAVLMRNYPQAELSVIGHAENGEQNALRAYEESTDKAINVAQQLVNYGIDPGQITAGGKGLYSPIAAAGNPANLRTDLFITVR